MSQWRSLKGCWTSVTQEEGTGRSSTHSTIQQARDIVMVNVRVIIDEGACAQKSRIIGLCSSLVHTATEAVMLAL